MIVRTTSALFCLLLLIHGCNPPGIHKPVQLKYKAKGSSPQLLAVYEPWWGHPQHINIGYSSHDPETLRKQIQDARSMGISGFVIDWYGDREPFIQQSYALLQKIAGEENFKVAMMYDETDHESDATDVAYSEFRQFHDTYLSPDAPGRHAYLTYQGRPVIFIFPKSGHTDWDRIRREVDTWNPKPFLINENLPGQYVNAFDGYYAWVQPGPGGWAPDGSHWGKAYLDTFYDTMVTKYPDKIIVGGAWSQFDDSRASWSLNRHIAGRCGETFKDTFNYWRRFIPANQPIPFLLIETWNDYEEGTAVERGIPNCQANWKPRPLP
jgi:hypothetical protein